MYKKVKRLLLLLIASILGQIVGHIIFKSIENYRREKIALHVKETKKRKTLKERVNDFSNRHYIIVKDVPRKDIFEKDNG